MRNKITNAIGVIAIFMQWILDVLGWFMDLIGFPEATKTISNLLQRPDGTLDYLGFMFWGGIVLLIIVNWPSLKKFGSRTERQKEAVTKPSSLDKLIKKCKEQDPPEFNRSIEIFLPHRLNMLRQLKRNYNKYNLKTLMGLNPTMIPDLTSGETRKEIDYMLERLEANGYIVTEGSKSLEDKIKFTDKWDEL